ncbi:MAG: glycosyltransferase family 4 protein [Chloroflexi bacterium]|nr:glycosyltransferase family 4 protein [Chloroflexota bacterium]
MRIGIDTQSTLGRKTGIGQYTAKLLGALRRVAPEHKYLELSLGREVVMRTDRRLCWQQLALPRRSRAAHADLLHVTGFDAPRWKPCPVVFTVHDLIGALFPENLPPIARIYWSRWLPFTVRFADAVLADSECTRRDIVRLVNFPPERITVVPAGVDEVFRPQAKAEIEAFRELRGLPQDLILYVGTIEPRKGIDTLIDAFADVAMRHPHHLLIAGKRGWYWEPILRRIADRGMEGRIHFLDYVPESDLPALYASAAVFVFPSRYEGFGLPVLEAMACGTPVICSNAASLPEVAGQAAILVPPDQSWALAEAIEAVLTDKGLGDDLREKGLHRAAEFTWEKTAQATLEVYRKVIRETSGVTRSREGGR